MMFKNFGIVIVIGIQGLRRAFFILARVKGLWVVFELRIFRWRGSGFVQVLKLLVEGCGSPVEVGDGQFGSRTVLGYGKG